MNRAVVDTNVLVSGLISPLGAPGQILDLIRAAKLQPVVDDRIFFEYSEVLQRPRLQRYFEKTEIDHILKFFRLESHWVVCTPSGRTLPDPSDIHVLETALTADVILITGNEKHFPAKVSHPAVIMNPAAYIEQYHHDSAGGTG